MRIQYALLLLILVTLSLCALAVFALINSSPVATNDTSAEPAQAVTQPSTDQPESLENLMSKYLAQPDYSRQCALAKSVALSRPKLLEQCAREMLKNIVPSEELVIAHFATSYYQLGGKQNELLSLLLSSDVELVRGVLSLLRTACEIDADRWQLDRPLGGPEMPSRIARIAATHPELSAAVASTLGVYGQGIYKQEVKNEMRVLLKMLLSDDEGVVLLAYFAILQTDQGVCDQFGLDVEPLSEQQKADIREYLKANP